MRIGRKQLAGSIRTATLVSACLALVAMTSGLLLAIHLLGVDHTGHHDSHECSICQHLLIAPQKATVVPNLTLTYDTSGFHEDVLVFNEHVQAHHLEISPPRGPPCSCRSSSV